MLRLLDIVLSVAVVAAQPNPTWYGFRPTASSPTSSVDLVDLNDGAKVRTTIGSVALGTNEFPWTDAVRCLNGFCMFTTSAVSSQGTLTSFIYNISWTDASVTIKAPCPNVCHNLHADYTTGHAYTLSIDPTKNTSVVTLVTNGHATPVADVSGLVKDGRVSVGQTTHCSLTHHMYIGVDNGGAGKDIVIAVDLVAGKADGVTTLQVPLFKALWGTCDGSGVIGGISFTPGQGNANGTAEFGTVDTNGAYSAKASISVPPSFAPNGLLTATSPASFKDDFIATMYKEGDESSGYMWAVDPYGGGADDFLSPIEYRLIGAAWDRE